LIEAGNDQGQNPVQEIPMLHARSSEDREMSWNFFVQHYNVPARQFADTKMTWETPDGKRFVGAYQPPPEAKNAKMKGIFYPRSGTLGGCTAHNAMVSVYPHEMDWKLIEQLTGDQSWSPENMRQVFVRMEKSNYASGSKESGHGEKGWLNINLVNVSNSIVDVNAISEQVSKSLRRRQVAAVGNMASILTGAASVVSGGGIFSAVSTLGRMINKDLNSAAPERDISEGMFTIPLAMKDGKRAGSRDIIMETYSATTPEGKKMYPLDIALNTFATKVTFDHGTIPKANGVDILSGPWLYRNSPLYKADSARTPGHFVAEKEVVISAGAFNTPQLLKLSGIGPKEELSKFSIPIVADVPGVGTNLQDHMEIGVTHEIGEIPAIGGCTFGKNNSDPCITRWKNNGVSMYSAGTNGLPFAVLKKTSVAHLDNDFAKIPDLFLFGGPTSFRGYYPGYSDDAYRLGNWTWVVLKAHTANRAGTVTLRSADPLDQPEVNFNFFDGGDATAARNDLQSMAEGIEYARSMSTARTKLVEILPGPKRPNLKEYIKNESWCHHASCTCPIGAADDKMAVLDSKLRVRGVNGLRVADASVFPRIPGFFVALPTYMIGEKAADFILNNQ
jgi:choline dehydrogenase